MQLWKSLTKSLKSKMLEERASEPKSDYVLAEKANLFGKVVADTLLQYQIKECIYLKKKIMDVFLTMISKNKLDMGPLLWVLDLLVIAHPAHPQPPKKQIALVKIVTLICYLQTVSSAINRQAQQLTKCFNHFRQHQLTHRIL